MQAWDLRQRVARLDPVERLQQRLRERAADPECLADGAHLSPQRSRVAGELLEVEAGRLHGDVVERRLEGGAGDAGDVVRQLVERVADRQQRGELRDREAGRLRRERGRTRNARVHLDQLQLTRSRLVRELDVGAAGGDADGAGAGEGGVAEPLQLAVRQRLLRCDGPRVTRVDAHRVEVLDRADDDAVPRGVGDDLELELLPALERALDEHLADRARVEAVLDPLAQLGARARDPAAAAAERERGAHDRGNGAVVELLERGDDDALRHGQAGCLHRRAEAGTVFCGADRVQVGADQLDAVLGEDAVLGQLDGEIESGLPAEGGKERVRLFAADDLGERRHVERLEVGGVGPFGVGHDRRRVRVREHDAVALGAQRAAGLDAGVVELAALADPDRPGADDQDAMEIRALRHAVAIRSKKGTASCGPGAASGWNWSVSKPSPRSPSTVPSLSETWLTSAASPGATAKP